MAVHHINYEDEDVCYLPKKLIRDDCAVPLLVRLLGSVLLVTGAVGFSSSLASVETSSQCFLVTIMEKVSRDGHMMPC